jgi:alpha-beta hydrolase superfamily lysophospholipase
LVAPVEELTRPPEEGDGTSATPADGATAPALEKFVASIPVDHVGTSVYVKCWRRLLPNRPSVIVVHDLGEHTELYRNAALDLVGHGFNVYVFDLRGHGRSGRRLGHAPSFNVLVRDLLQVAAWVRHKEGGQPPVIIGHGIGALITMDFTKAHGNLCRAAVLSAPCLELASKVSLAARFIIRVLAEVAPMLRIPAMLAPRFAKELKHAHQPDPGDDEDRISYFPRLTAVFAQELLSAIQRAEARFIEYHGSVLILCPEDDVICSYRELKKSAAIHNENNLEIATLPGVGHSVLTEDEECRRKAFDVMIPWLSRVLSGTPRDPLGDLKIHGASRR